MKQFITAAVLLIFFGSSKSQTTDWIDQMQDHNVNFYTVQQSFNDAWKERAYEKGKGWKQFKRWEEFTSERVFPDGERPSPTALVDAFNTMQQAQTGTNTGGWKARGPFNGNPLGGVGRINRVVFDPTNSQIVWAGAPAGGLWKSTDGGSSWSTNTDLLPNLGVSDIAIDPTNTQIMYLATGDKDGGDTYSYGLLKSIDGGGTWNSTGLKFNITQLTRISGIYINPNNTDIIVVGTRSGIYRSIDAGASFSLIQSGIFNRIIQQPGNPDVLYSSTIISSSSDVWRSTNNGLSWTQMNNVGIPSNGIRRMEIAVTPDDSTYVYALGTNSNNGLEGVYRSTDTGLTWTKRTTTNSPNLLGWSTVGSDSGGQGWYDLALAVDPNDKDLIYTGGVNVWRSNSGGSTWTLSGHWFGGGNAAYVHADVHDLHFTPDGRLYAGTDGGVYRRPATNNNWVSLNDGMNISQYYRISGDGNDTTLLLAGAQDNGTHRLNNGTWDDILGGDGMDCAVNPKNSSVVYASSQYGNFRKSTNRGSNFNASFGLPNSVRGSGAWVTPIRIDPIHPDTLYIGFSSMYRSFNAGISFSSVGSGYNGGDIDQIAISPTHTNVVYIAENADFYRSDNYAGSFINLSNKIPGSRTITQIAVAFDDPMHVYITKSGYTNGEKIFESFDGGDNWNNITNNLPNIPANCVVPSRNAEEGLYVGTDLGVFYTDVNIDGWVAYNSGLPNVIVRDLEINYVDNKLKAGTYGRGIWETDLYENSTAPLVDFVIPNAVCDGDTIKLTDASSYSPTSWNWTITPSNFVFVNGTSQNSQNPEIVFTQSGIFDIALTATNALGSNSSSIISAISVGGFPLPFIEDFEATNSMDKWDINDPSPLNWSRFGVGGNSLGNNAARAYLFNNVAGPYTMTTPNLDFRNHDSTHLTFDYAYSGRVINNGDSLKVYISTNCSENWTLLGAYGENGTNNFATQNVTNFLFAPATAADWCGNPGFGMCGDIDLTAYANFEGVRIRFEAVSSGGNNMFLDNIQIVGLPSVAPTADFGAGSTIVCAQEPVNFIDQSFGSPSSYEWTFNGGTPATSTLKNPTVVYTSGGTFSAKLKVTSHLGVDSITKTALINVNPADSVSMSLTATSGSICPGDSFNVSINATNAGLNPVYEWFVNGNMIYTGSSTSRNFMTLQNGDEVYVVLNSSESCAFPAVLVSDTLTVQMFASVTVQITHPGALCFSDAPVSLVASPAGGTFTGFGLNGNVFDPSTTGSGNHQIFYQYTSPNGCVYTDQISISVDVPVAVSVSTIPDVCFDESLFFLHYGSPAGGTFSGPGVYQNYFFADSVSPGTYTLYYSFQSGNCSMAMDSTTINVLAAPAAPSIINQGLDLECSVVASSYQWYLNGNPVAGANSRIYTPNSAGNYTVTIENSIGCESEASQSVNFGIGLVENSNARSFTIYPNPATKRVNIELETITAPEATLTMTNNIGQIVMTKKLDKQTHIIEELDISSFPGGVYVISIEGDNMNLAKKLVIQ